MPNKSSTQQDPPRRPKPDPGLVAKTSSRISVGDITGVSGEINIAGGDIFLGYSPDQVSTLITQITATFQPKPFEGRSPYKGLDVFDEDDAELFFGREKLVEDLVNRVKTSRTVFITGPSGSGKSSVVRAGLIPALKRGAIQERHSEQWLYATVKPGRAPLEALALAFSRLKSPELADYFRAHVTEISILNACAESILTEHMDQRFVLFIDQFEEVFTQISKEEERGAFLKVLTNALAVENGRVLLLFTMRSDFVSNCATYPALNAMLNQPSAFAQIGAMQPDELVSAIAEPALRVGLRIDPDLIAQIINDMEGEPGTLPLMQFALKDLFVAEQAKGGLIAFTREAYHERGGIHKSLQRHADNAFTQLSESEQVLAHSIFSSLIEIGRGTPDTGRTASFDELIPANTKPEAVEAIVQKLADARLITTDEVAGKDLVTISHEKLIDAWPWLRKLVNENREVIAIQNEIASDAREWDEHQRDSSYLYAGARLATAREKLEAKKLVLSGLALDFVQSSRAQQRRNQTLIITGVSAIVVLLAMAVIVFGYQSKVNAQLARVALARQLAARAMVIQDDKRDIAMLLSIEANKINPDAETQGSLLSALQCCSDELTSFLSGHTDSIWDVAFSPDGKWLASSGNDGSIILWDVASRRLIRRLVTPDSSATIYAIAFSPTENILAAGDGTGAITLYDTHTWKPLTAPWHGHSSSVLSMKFSNDGKLLASAGTDGKVLVWDMHDRKILKTFLGHTSWVWDVAFSPDNKTVASVGRYEAAGDNTLYLWSLESDSTLPLSIGVPYGVLVSVAFNNDSLHPLMLTGDWNGNVIVWDLRPWLKDHEAPLPSPRLKSGPGATTDVWGLMFIPGDNLAFFTGRDNRILNRNRIILNSDFSQISLQRETLGVTGNNTGVFRIAVSPNGKLVAAAGQDGLVSLWSATESPSVIRQPVAITNLQILNGQAATVVSVDQNGDLFHWDYSKQKILSKLVLNSGKNLQSAISLDGTKVATGNDSGLITLWNGESGKRLLDYSSHTAPITSLVFSSDGRYLASSDNQGKVILWTVGPNNQLTPSTPFTDTHNSAVETLLFSSDGKTLIGGGCGYPITFPSPECSQGAIYVWDTQPKLKLRFKPLPGKAGFIWSMALNPANPDELAVGTRDGTVTIWSLSKQSSRLSFRLGKSDITALAFSPDGKWLAIGADVYKVFIYDAQSGQLFGQAFLEHDGSVIALAFTPDGHRLLSASTDGTVVIHDMQPADWLSHACQVVNRNLTRAEWNTYIGEALSYQAVCSNLPIEAEATPTPNLTP